MSTVKKTTQEKIVEVKEQNSQAVIYSDKNLYFDTYGHIDRGYNIVKTEFLDIYLQHKSVREASALELAKHYGIK
jgi:hypothetical protein